MPVKFKHATKCIAPAKKSSYPRDCSDIAVIILAAAPSKNLKQVGCRSLLPLRSGKLVIHHQLEVVQSTFAESEIWVVGGIDHLKLLDELPSAARFIINPFYEEFSAIYSLYLTLLACKKEKIVVIAGDLLFNNEFLSPITAEHSAILAESKGQIDEKEIGTVSVNGTITNFAFGVEQKWAHSIVLVGRELNLLRAAVKNPDNHKRLLWEVLNDLIDDGAEFRLEDGGNKSKVFEIDTQKHLAELAEIRWIK